MVMSCGDLYLKGKLYLCRGLLVASCGQVSGIAGVCQAAEEKSRGSSVESGPKKLGSMHVCGVEKGVKLKESGPIFKFFSFHIMLFYITLTGRDVFGSHNIETDICIRTAYRTLNTQKHPWNDYDIVSIYQHCNFMLYNYVYMYIRILIL